MNQKTRIVTASIVAVVGIVIAVAALYRASAPHESHVQIDESIDPHIQAFFESLVLDARPTEATVDSLVGKAAARAESLARQLSATSRVFTQGRVEDFALAFKERLYATLVGDFERNRRDLLARGDTRTDDEAAALRTAWERTSAQTHLSPFGIEQLDVRIVYEDGRRIAPWSDSRGEGFDALSAYPSPGTFPISLDAAEARLDVVEVRLPIEKTPVVGGGKGRAVLVGYQFAWNDERSQWMIWQIVLYLPPNHPPYSAIIF